MPVHAITPRVTAISGHLQFLHGMSCAGDCCNFDADQDDRAVGDPYDPEWPDKPLRLNPTRGSHVRPVRGARRGRAPMNEVADRRVGLDGRSATSTSSPSVGARGGAGEPTEPPGGGLVGSPAGLRTRRTLSSKARAVPGPLADDRDARRSPGAS